MRIAIPSRSSSLKRELAHGGMFVGAEGVQANAFLALESGWEGICNMRF